MHIRIGDQERTRERSCWISFRAHRSGRRRGGPKRPALQLDRGGPKRPFDFSQERYNDQLVAGYSKNTAALGLKVYMPDYHRVAKPRG